MSFSPAIPPDVPAHGAAPAVAAPAAETPAGAGAAGGAVVRRWSPWREIRRDWRWLVGLIGGLAVLGVPVGLLWWLLAPRADYRITSGGPVAIGNPSDEMLIADDAIFVLIVAALGLVAGVLTWLARKRRGVAVLMGVALGTLAAAVVAWQVGELLGSAPSKAALAHVGRRVSTSLTLGMLPALAVGPFIAVLVWLVAALYTRTDGLGRTSPAAPLDAGLGAAADDRADAAGPAPSRDGHEPADREDAVS